MSESLPEASILLAGAGHLGSFAGRTLAQRGCRRVLVVDRDRVEDRNLANQGYEPADVGRPKAEAIADAMRAIHPAIQVETFVGDLEDLPHGMFRGIDLCLAGLDSLRARQVVHNERAYLQDILVIDGAVDGDGQWLGSVQVIVPGEACLECAWSPEAYHQLARETPCNPRQSAGGPPTNSPALLGASIASLMVREAERVLSGPRPQESYEIYVDLKHERTFTSRLRRAAGCRSNHAVVRERLPLGRHFAAATIGDLLALVGEPVQLEFRRRLFDAGLFGGDRWLRREQLLPYAPRRLAEFGLTSRDRIRVQAQGLDAFIDLDN